MDIVIIGGGIAGATAGYRLAPRHQVTLLERESQPGYHATGRSAALFSETYGNAVIRALTRGSRDFFYNPPAGFTDVPLVSPRGVLMIGRKDQLDALDRAFDERIGLIDTIRRVDQAEALRISPILRPDYVAGGVVEPDARDMDVHAIHRGYLRGITAHGGKLVTGAEVLRLGHANGKWQVETTAGAFSGDVVINAAGAWCDEIAERAGIRKIGLVPKRRTAITFDPPKGIDSAHWPNVIDVGEEFYFKPDAGRILASPCDETPMPPQDVQPDEMDIAILIDRLETASTLKVPRLQAKWAGLRSFVSDRTIVAGYAPDAPGFFWLAAQGGYGIQTSAAMGRVSAALVEGKPLPADLQDLTVTEAQLSPARLQK